LGVFHKYSLGVGSEISELYFINKIKEFVKFKPIILKFRVQTLQLCSEPCVVGYSWELLPVRQMLGQSLLCTVALFRGAASKFCIGVQNILHTVSFTPTQAVK